MKITLRVALGLAVLCAVFYGYTAFLVWQAEKDYPPVGLFLTKNGQSLHYIKAGYGLPLILIHGDGGSLYDWKLSCFDTLA